MIDHAVLLERLTRSFGVTGTVHSWIQSYLCGSSQSVRIGGHSSSVTSCSVDVPQGSVLGTLFYLHLTSGNIAQAQRFPTAVGLCRWHTTLCYSVFYQSLRQYYKTSVMSVLTSRLVLRKRYGAKPNEIRRHSFWHTSKAQICIRPYFR